MRSMIKALQAGRNHRNHHLRHGWQFDVNRQTQQCVEVFRISSNQIQQKLKEI